MRICSRLWKKSTWLICAPERGGRPSKNGSTFCRVVRSNVSAWPEFTTKSKIQSDHIIFRSSINIVLFSRPKFAILDECTSAVSTDIEEHLYRRCQEIGTTLITVSHRMQLMKYHQYFLKLEDHGAWNFTKIEHNQ